MSRERLAVTLSRSSILLGLTALALAAAWGLDHALADEIPPPAPETAPAPDTAPPPPLAPESASTELSESPEPTTAPPEPPASTAEAPPPPAPETETEAETVPEVTVDATPPSPPPSAPPAAEETHEARAENVIEAKHKGYIPAYQLHRPSWGVAMTGSIAALGKGDIAASQAGATARAIEIQAEYQFPFLQSIGVLSLGPSAALYPMTPSDTATSSPRSIWSVGGQVRYQARYFREQPLVPIVGFEGQRLAYSFKDGTAGAAILTGPVFGGMLLLNLFEPSSASEFYIDQGVSRSYLVAEYKTLSGSDGTITVSGASIFFGLRFEF